MFPETTSHLSRTGFSIIEVLTSIVVAMIGVFGVMILIPFAIKQAESGLDGDAATVVARNAFAQFEVAGYRNPGNWVTATTPDNVTPYSIDPLAITENAIGADTSFPFNDLPAGASPIPANYEIESANLLVPSGGQMSVADARRMFRASDDLMFGDPVDTALTEADLNPPMQIMDMDGATPLRRQSQGAFSWSAIVVPEGSTTKYRMFILVYKDRMARLNVVDPDNDFKMSTAQVTQPQAAAAPVSNITLETGVTIADNAIRKDDWVMLINRSVIGTNQYQIGFYRVVNYDGDDPVEMTLDGPDFVFSNSEETHVVHLKNVVSVYERTFRPEGQSTWTVSY